MVEVHFLGSGNAFCPTGRMHSLVLIDGGLLVDAPPTLLAQLRIAGISPDEIDALLVTHWHGDHTFGFPFLLLERRYISDREGEHTLDVHAHTGGEQRLGHLCELAFPGSLGDVLAERVRFHEHPSGEIEGLVRVGGGWTYERYPVHHVPETEPHGYSLVHESGLVLLHCGDSGPCSEIERRASDADVVIIELGIPDGVPSDFHYKPSTLSELALACPETTFLATHLYTESGPESTGEVPSLPPNVIQVSDGDRFLLENSSVTRISN